MRSPVHSLMLPILVPLLLCAAEPESPPAFGLQPGVRVRREFRTPSPDRLSVALKAGEFFRIDLMQVGYDIAVTLRDPANIPIALVDSANGRNGPEVVAGIAQTSGNYLLEIRSSSAAITQGI